MKSRKEDWALTLANWILRTFAPNHSRVIELLIKAGMATCDNLLGSAAFADPVRHHYPTEA